MAVPTVVTLMLAFGLVTSATAQQQEAVQGLEPGPWYTAQQVSAQLQAERHQPLAFMEFLLVDIEEEAAVDRSVVFSANADGEWYLLKGNAEQGKASHFSVILQGDHVDTHDYRTKTRPDFSDREYDRSRFLNEAKDIARSIGLSISAVPYDEALDNAENGLGQYVFLQAETDNGGVITLTADPEDHDFAITMTHPGGGGVTVVMQTGQGIQPSEQVLAQFESER